MQKIKRELLVVRIEEKMSLFGSYEILDDTDERYSIPKNWTYYFSLKTDYKDIIFTQEATGLWSEALLDLVDPDCETFESLRKLQTSPKLADLPVQILLTLVGIHLL